MNIDKQYAWQSVEDCRKNNPLLPRNLRGLVIGIYVDWLSEFTWTGYRKEWMWENYSSL